MFKIGSYTQVLRGLGLVEPVLSLDIIFLLFLGIEGTTQQRDAGVVGDVACDAEGSEVGEEAVFFLSVKEHLEALHVLHRSESGLAVGWLEVVMIIRDVADEVQFPALVGLIAQICLVVEIVWLILALGLHGAQEIGGGLVSYAVEP